MGKNLYALAKERLELVNSLDEFEIFESNLNKGISIEGLDKIQQKIKRRLPEELINIYTQINGFSFSWECSFGEETIYGSIQLWSLENLLFGMGNVKSYSNYQNPNEDVLWNDFFDKEIVDELKTHKIIEDIEGEDSFITCRLNEEKVDLFLVEDSEIVDLPISLKNYYLFIVETLGVEDVRARIGEKNFLKDPLKYEELGILSKRVPINFTFLS